MNLKVIIKAVKILLILVFIYLTIFAVTFTYFPINFNSLMRIFKYAPEPTVPSYTLYPVGLFMSDGSFAALKYAGVFDLLMGDRSFITSAEHRERFGIETAKLSSNDENKLHEMIKKIVDAQTKYYETEKEENLEKVKSLFVSDKEFNQFKEILKMDGDSYKGGYTEILGYGDMKETKFSSPRKYKGLDDRIGILSYTKFNNSNPSSAFDTLPQFYIFKRMNNEWKIEIFDTDIPFGIENAEKGYLQQLIEAK